MQMGFELYKKACTKKSVQAKISLKNIKQIR